MSLRTLRTALLRFLRPLRALSPLRSLPFRHLPRALAFTIVLGGLVACGHRLVPGRQGLVIRDVQFPMRDIRFPSGLRVIAERDVRSPNVALALVVGAGSTSDPPGKEGLAHYVEHLTFRSRPFGKSSTKQLLERAGVGKWNAFTEFDYTYYYEVGSATTLAELLRVEGLRMMAPVMKVAPETLAVEREVVRSELRHKSETGFAGSTFAALQQAVFPPGHDYARPLIGTHGSISSLTAEDVDAFVLRHYRPEKMTLTIVGNFDLEKIQQTLEATLPPEILRANAVEGVNRLAGRLSPQAPEPPAPPPARPLTKEIAAVPTPEIWLAWSLPRTFDTESHIAEFVKRSVEGVVYGAFHEDADIGGIDVDLVLGTQASLLICRVGLANGEHPEQSLEHVLNRVFASWERVEGVERVIRDDRAFDARKRRALVDMLIDGESIASRAVDRGVLTHFSGDAALYSRAVSSVSALQRTQMISFAKKYLGRDRVRARYFVPPESGGETPMPSRLSAPASGEPDTAPLVVDAKRLEALAPPIGAAQYREGVLENGLTYIIAPRMGIPVVRSSIAFHGGASLDPAASGLADLLAFPKATYHGSPEAFGAHLASSIGPDVQTYSIEGAAGNVEIMLGSLSERVRSMHISPGAVKSALHRETPYIRRLENHPEAIAQRAFQNALFDGTPYARAAVLSDLEESSIRAAQDFIDRTHRPENAVLVVVGELDPDHVVKLIEDQFGSWSKGAGLIDPPAALHVPRFRPQGEALWVRTVFTPRPNATQSQIHIGCVLPPSTSSATYARYAVTARYVQDRLYASLRENLGVTYGVYARATTMRGGTTTLDITTDVDAANTEKALVVIKDLLRGTVKTPPTSSDLAWAKWRLVASHGTSYLSNRAIAYELLDLENVGRAPSLLDTFATDVARVTAEDVRADIRACLDGRVALSLLGSESSIMAASAVFSRIED